MAGWPAPRRCDCPGQAGTDNSPDDFKWELYHVAEDFSEANNLAGDESRQAQGTARPSSTAKRRNTTSCRSMPRWSPARTPSIRPSLTRGRSEFTYYPGTIRIPEGAAPDVRTSPSPSRRTSRFPKAAPNGVLATQGGRFGGWGSAHHGRQAGVCLRFLQPAAAQVPHRVEGEACCRQAHHQVRLQVRRSRHRQGRHRHADRGRQAGRRRARSNAPFPSDSRSTRRSTSARTPARPSSRTTSTRCPSSSPASSTRS